MYDDKTKDKNQKTFSDSEVRGERSHRNLSINQKDKWGEKK